MKCYIVDRLVVEKTGKHLDDVQKAVVEGTWQRETYDDIAKKCHVTEGHVSDVGSELWQFLSEALGEDIKKSNFSSVFKRLNIESCENSNIYINGINNGFYYLETSHYKDKNNTKKYNKTQLSYHDLTFAPKIRKFYNRESELQNLYHWILNQNIRLISVLGLSGIGKTTLVKRFVDLNIDQFEVIIWKNLKFPKSLNLLVNENKK
jgi:ABC-type glutathione transport system ATPase component